MGDATLLFPGEFGKDAGLHLLIAWGYVHENPIFRERDNLHLPTRLRVTLDEDVSPA